MRRRDTVTARDLVEAVARGGEAGIDVWRKLSPLRRNDGDLVGAHAALRCDPCDFVSLLGLASLLD